MRKSEWSGMRKERAGEKERRKERGERKEDGWVEGVDAQGRSKSYRLHLTHHE